MLTKQVDATYNWYLCQKKIDGSFVSVCLHIKKIFKENKVNESLLLMCMEHFLSDMRDRRSRMIANKMFDDINTPSVIIFTRKSGRDVISTETKTPVN